LYGYGESILSPYLEHTSIGITVIDGFVTLTGNVEHRYQIARAEELASGVPGVWGVKSDLQVKSVAPEEGMIR
jgi:osmotically-inducible protein OsmY